MSSEEGFAYELVKGIQNIDFPGYLQMDAIVQKCPRPSPRETNQCDNCPRLQECKDFYDKVICERPHGKGYLERAKKGFYAIKGRKYEL